MYAIVFVSNGDVGRAVAVADEDDCFDAIHEMCPSYNISGVLISDLWNSGVPIDLGGNGSLQMITIEGI